jgi:hypothetical protein
MVIFSKFGIKMQLLQKIQDWSYCMCFFQSKAMISFNQRKTKKLMFLLKIEKKAVNHRRWRAISCQTLRPQKSIDDCIDFSNSFFFNQNFAIKEKKFLKENFEIF